MLIVSEKTSPPKKTNFFNIILLWEMAGRPGRSGKMPGVPFLGYIFYIAITKSLVMSFEDCSFSFCLMFCRKFLMVLCSIPSLADISL